MICMTVQELSDKLRDMIEHSEIQGDMLVTDAGVVQENDIDLIREYAPGTVLFNLTDSQDKSYLYQLSLYPARIGKWLN